MRRAFLPDGPRIGQVRAALAALGITVGSLCCGILGIVLVGATTSALGVRETAVVRVFQSNFIQVGFAAFAVLYLLRRDDRTRYLRVRWPTREDLAWIVLLPAAFALQPLVLQPVLTVAGLPHPHPGAGTGQIALESRPLLWPVAFVGLFLFAAPAEELVYRGILQGRLRPVFDTVGVVLLGGLSFGLMHCLVGLVTPSVGLGGSLYWGLDALVPGLLWGYAYERTENLLVTAVTHAMTWTVAVHEVVLQVLPV